MRSTMLTDKRTEAASFASPAEARTDTGEIDAESLDTDTRYRLPDGGIYLWDGSHFQPYQ
jgi:hypothetical protein